jgi:hypothetical protein
MRERPLSSVPRLALAILVLGLGSQIALHFSQPPRQARAENLGLPPSMTALRFASFGEPIGLAKLLTLHLQGFDNQPGTMIPFRKLDYDMVQQWLGRIMELDPPAQYPMMLASRVYGGVLNNAQQRKMAEFVYERFLDDPNRRWQWLAEEAIMAKHRLKDLPLARKYARAIRLHATGKDVPAWAKQMEIYILEDMNEVDSAKSLIAALLRDGKITDPNELRFLEQHLATMEQRAPSKP